MRRGGWRSRYRLPKQSVEPVFGRIKEALGLRRFLQRGLANVAAEWIVDEPMLLSPSVGTFVEPKRLAPFVRELVQPDLDVSSIE